MDKSNAIEPYSEVEGLVIYKGDEYRFYCEKCLNTVTKLFPHNLSHEVAYVFDPFAKKKKESGFWKIAFKDILEFATKLRP